MAEDEPKKFEMPDHVRALLEPYRNLPTEGSTAQPTKIEQTFHPSHSRVDDTLLKAIGRVATTWSILEFIIEKTLSRLALGVSFSTLALTNDLGIDNRLKAMKALLRLHSERYRHRIVDLELHNALSALPVPIAKLKDERNRVIHWVWSQSGKDRMFGIRFRATTESAIARSPINPYMTADEINQLADKIQATADALFQLAQLLPEVDEGQHAKLLSQAARRLRPDSQ